MNFQAQWDAFWKGPSEAGLKTLLGSGDAAIHAAIRSTPWDPDRRSEDGEAPRPCFRVLGVLAGADPRARHREAKGKRSEELGLSSLGEPVGFDGRDALRFHLRAATALWDRFLAAGAAPAEPELLALADEAFSDHLWERIDWLGSSGVGTRSIRPVEASLFFARVWESAGKVDSSLGLGSRMMRFLQGRANGRNRWFWRAQAMCSPECRSGWNPLDESSGAPLWKELAELKGLNDMFSEALAEIMGAPGGPLDTDAALCKAFLGQRLCLDFERLFVSSAEESDAIGDHELLSRPWGDPETPTGAALAARWAARGQRLGASSVDGEPDWLWAATRQLMAFESLEDDELDDGLFAKSSHSQTRRWRSTMFALLEWVWRQGADPFWAGPDGQSAAQAMAATPGYQRWVARAEQEALEQEAQKASEESQSARSL